MRWFFRTGRFKILLGIVGALAVLLIVAKSMNGWASPQSAFWGTVVTPVQRFAADVSRQTKNFFGARKRLNELEAENERLRKELVTAETKLAEYETVKNENEMLRKFYGFREEHRDFKLQTARVVAYDPEDVFGSFSVDCGSLKGVAPGDPVVSAEGALVGRVLRTAPTYSVVVTLLAPEPDMSVSALAGRTSESGPVSGTLELAERGLTKMSFLSRQSGIAVGDLIVTSGVGGMYPKGLLIGTVEEILPEKQNVSKYATVRPAANLKDLKEVAVILSFDGQ